MRAQHLLETPVALYCRIRIQGQNDLVVQCLESSELTAYIRKENFLGVWICRAQMASMKLIFTRKSTAEWRRVDVTRASAVCDKDGKDISMPPAERHATPSAKTSWIDYIGAENAGNPLAADHSETPTRLEFFVVSDWINLMGWAGERYFNGPEARASPFDEVLSVMHQLPWSVCFRQSTDIGL